MNTWIILLITYGGVLEGHVSVIPLPTQDVCEEMMETASEALMPILPDTMFQCIRTDTPVALVRPKPRPLDLMKGKPNGRP